MYYNEPIDEEIKSEIYLYLLHIKEFENFDTKVEASSYILRHYAEKSKYIFSIDYECDSTMVAVDGIVKLEEEGYTLQYTSSLDRSVKADTFRIEDDKVIRKSFNLRDKTTDKKEFDKKLFFEVKSYKKD